MADISLDDFAAQVATELGIADLQLDTDQVLDLARIAAHSVVRPAAPLATFIAGLSAGLAGGSAADIQAAIDRATAVCRRVGGGD